MLDLFAECLGTQRTRQLLLTVGYLFLMPLGSFSQAGLDEDNVLIPREASWLYYDSIMPDNEPWFSELNENLGWKTGYAEFGYGDGDETTLIGYGGDKDNKYITSYFYKSFDVAEPEAYIGYLLNIIVDDGAVVYLNGSEIWRLNIPEGKVTGGTRSMMRVANEAEEMIQVFVLEAELLRRGKNIIAVSVHQRDADTSDCSFSLELLGAKDTKLIHQILRNEGAKLDEKLNDLMIELSLRDRELELKVKDQELELSRLYVSIIVGVISLLLIVVLIFWFSQTRRNKTIAKNNAQLKDELIGKNRELINLSMEQLNKNRLIHDLETDLSNLDDSKDSSQLVVQLKHKLSSYSIQDKEWENLQLHFENVHSDYFKRLRSDFPALTSSELRLCGYIKLQLTTKEIANMLYVEPKSVQTSRYRLKKKLNVPNGEDLIQFLSKYY